LSFCRHYRYNCLIHSGLRSDDKRRRVDTLCFAHNQRAQEKIFAAQEKIFAAQEKFFAAQEKFFASQEKFFATQE